MTVDVGDTKTEILGIGKVAILPTFFIDKCVKIILLETLFSPGFHTNLVSMQRLEKNGLIWNPRAGVLETESPVTEICRIERKLRTYFIEWNDPTVSDMMTRNWDDIRSFSSRKSVRKSTVPHVSKASTEIWHRRYAHISEEAIRHLEDAVEGVEVVDARKKSDVSPCETCSLSAAPRQISQRPLKRTENPFEKLHFDLIQLNEGYNGDCYANLFLCDATRFHLLTTFAGKDEATRSVEAVLDWIKTQYGIQCHQTVPYTPEQNRPIARSGGVVIKKSREPAMPEFPSEFLDMPEAEEIDETVDDYGKDSDKEIIEVIEGLSSPEDEKHQVEQEEVEKRAADNENEKPKDDKMSLNTYFPRQEIDFDFDEANIIHGPRERATEQFTEISYKKQRAGFLISLLQNQSYPDVVYAFLTALIRSVDLKNYQDNIQPGPHEEFLETAEKEIDRISRKNTYRIVDHQTKIAVIPVKWVYTYKPNKDRIFF